MLNGVSKTPLEWAVWNNILDLCMLKTVSKEMIHYIFCFFFFSQCIIQTLRNSQDHLELKTMH